MEETLDAYAQLIKAGKVRAIGASNFSAPRLAQALEISRKHGLPRYESLQPLYNLYDRAEFEQDLRQLCLDQGVGVINFYALAAGLPDRQVPHGGGRGQEPARQDTVGKYLNPRGLRILAALDEVAAGTGSTPARVAVAWLMAQPGITSPIASATSLEQLAELTAAAQLVLTRRRWPCSTRPARRTERSIAHVSGRPTRPESRRGRSSRRCRRAGRSGRRRSVLARKELAVGARHQALELLVGQFVELFGCDRLADPEFA